MALYGEGKVTLWRAAGLAGLSLWEMMEIVKERQIPIRYPSEDFCGDFEAVLKEGC